MSLPHGGCPDVSHACSGKHGSAVLAGSLSVLAGSLSVLAGSLSVLAGSQHPTNIKNTKDRRRFERSM